MARTVAEEAGEAFPRDRVVVLAARLALLPMDPTVPMAVVVAAAHLLSVGDRGHSTRRRGQHRSSRAASSSPLAVQ